MSPIKIEFAIEAAQKHFGDTAVAKLDVGERAAMIIAVAKAFGLEYDDGTGQIWDPKAPRIEIHGDNSRYGRRRMRR